MLWHIFVNYGLSTLRNSIWLFVPPHGTRHPLWLIHYFIVPLFSQLFDPDGMGTQTLTYTQPCSKGLSSPHRRGAREERPWFSMVIFPGDEFIIIQRVLIVENIQAASICYIQKQVCICDASKCNNWRNSKPKCKKLSITFCLDRSCDHVVWYHWWLLFLKIVRHKF